jgi:hypothetical protein
VWITKASGSELLRKRRKQMDDIETRESFRSWDESGGCLLIGQAVLGRPRGQVEACATRGVPPQSKGNGTRYGAPSAEALTQTSASWVKPMLGVATALSAEAGVGTHQSSGRAAKSRLVFLYHAIPDNGFFHLPCISLKALLWVSSPLATISFKCASSAFITSLAVFPWSGKSHGPPNCLHVVVFIRLASFHSVSAVN